VLELSGSARSDHVRSCGFLYSPDQGKIETLLHPIGALAGGQNRFYPVAGYLLCPFDGVGARCGPASIDIDFVSGWQTVIDCCIDGHGDPLRPERLDHLSNDLGFAEGGTAR